MKKFMIMALSLILVCAALTGCGCSADINGTTTPSTQATAAPTEAPTAAPTAPPTTMPTTPSSSPTVPSTEDTMPGIIDGTSGQDGTVGTEGANDHGTTNGGTDNGGTDVPRHSRGMNRG